MEGIIKSLHFSLLVVFGTAGAQSFFLFHHQDVKSGTTSHFPVPISTGQDSTFIPIFNGAKNGETLGITAGVHACEYAPILAAQKLAASINPERLSGVVILVQLAAIESFLGRSPYVSPVYGKNLNRSFPSKSTGTNTEKVADLITDRVISRADSFYRKSI